ncbi:MAG: hypothetical protein H8E44_30105 [Planctomycetes bacterium]|nr:hypothetical protein [Planctomycetota bacterium]MBL7039636.1 hypothetical protein [Pirellulaceae bacterium]
MLRVLIIAQCALLSGVLVAEVSAADPGSRPNVLLIVVDDLNDWVGCLPAHFRANGYETAGAGKIFHHYQNHPSSWDDFWPSKNLQFPPTHVPAKEYQPAFDRKPRPRNWYMDFNWGPLDKVVEETGDWMSMKFVSQKLQEKRDPSADSGQAKPFFLACGIYRPHVPWFVPRKFFDMFPPDRIQLPPSKADDQPVAAGPTQLREVDAR